jgi:hypothetical protein
LNRYNSPDICEYTWAAFKMLNKIPHELALKGLHKYDDNEGIFYKFYFLNTTVRAGYCHLQGVQIPAFLDNRRRQP